MDFIEPCFGIGHNLSLICQMTSEDIKHQLIIIMHKKKYVMFVVFLYCFHHFLFNKFNLVLKNQIKRTMISACPSLVMIKKIIITLCLMFVYKCFVSCLCMDCFCRFDLRKGLRMRKVLKCAFACDRVYYSVVHLIRR